MTYDKPSMTSDILTRTRSKKQLKEDDKHDEGEDERHPKKLVEIQPKKKGEKVLTMNFSLDFIPSLENS